MAHEIVVIGGGLIGCATACRLAGDGHRVTLLERLTPGCGASGASAGMIAPQAEASLDSPMLEIGLASRALYREWIDEIRESVGLDPGFRNDGLVLPALDDAGRRDHSVAHAAHRARGLAVEKVERHDLEKWYGPIRKGIDSGLYLPDECQVRPRPLVEALVLVARARGVDVRAGVTVTGLSIDGGRVRGVLTDVGPLAADDVVLAAGCWSGFLANEVPDAPEIEPIRGQLIEIEPDRPLTGPLLHAPAGYVVPRGGTVLIGSTTERAGYDAVATAAGVCSLRDTAARLIPSLADARLVSAWAGLRPGSPDGLPTLGRSELGGLVYATGHYRNGVLLAPITAEIVSDLIGGRASRVDPTPFRPGRWRGAAPRPAG